MNSQRCITFLISTTTSHRSSRGSTTRCSQLHRTYSSQKFLSSSRTTSVTSLAISIPKMDRSSVSTRTKISLVIQTRTSSSSMGQWFQYLQSEKISDVRSMREKSLCRLMSSANSKGFLSTRTDHSSDGTNTATRRLLSTSTKKIADVTTISSVSQVEVSQYLSDMWLVRTSGLGQVLVSSIHMETSWKISSPSHPRSARRI